MGKWETDIPATNVDARENELPTEHPIVSNNEQESDTLLRACSSILSHIVLQSVGSDFVLGAAPVSLRSLEYDLAQTSGTCERHCA